MQTELAQIISLTSYGNEFLRSGTVPANYFPGNTVFQHCNLVDFRDFKKTWYAKKLRESVSAENPFIWFKNLKDEGCTKLRLYYTASTDTTFGPEYNLAGFVGGAGTWLIETIFDNYSYYWQKRWQVTDQNAADSKIWAVNYARHVQKIATSNQQEDISAITINFKILLAELIKFCREQELQYWETTFGKALNMFSSNTPNKEYYHHDLIVVNNYTIEAQQLLFAIGDAWVFGGMIWVLKIKLSMIIICSYHKGYTTCYCEESLG